jgi:hypothetical protein
MVVTMVCLSCGASCEVRRKGRKYCGLACYRTEQIRRSINSGLPEGLRRCSKCGEHKSQTDGFYTQGTKGSPSGKIARWCKACRCEDERSRRIRPAVVQKHRSLYSTDMAFRARVLVKNIEKKCRKERLAFDLDADWLASRLTKGRCELTGLPFTMTTVSAEAYSPSVDRIRAGQGYTKDNCRVVLYALNMAMNSYGLEIFVPIAEALVARYGVRVAS